MKDGAIRRYAQKVIATNLDNLAGQLEIVINPRAVNAVHDFRVAVRRLRNFFWIFRNLFRKKNIDAWEKSIRKAARSLSTVRDLDVQIAFLVRLKRRVKEEEQKTGIGKLIEMLRFKRFEERKNTGKPLEILISQNVIGRIRKNLIRLKKGTEPVSLDSLYNLAERRIINRLMDFHSYEPFIHLPHNKNELHRLRISVKKLRYTLETFETLYGDLLGTFIETYRKVQNQLGTLHDLDVWIESMPNLSQNVVINDEITTGMKTFFARCYEFRDITYHKFVRTWTYISKRKIGESLILFIRSRKTGEDANEK